MSVEAIKKALEGVTPGPWGYVASNENHGPYVCNDWGAGDICDGYVMSKPDSLSIRNGGDSKPINHQNDEADANMRYIAAVNPEAISDLLSTLESLQRENEERKVRIEKLEQTLKAVTGNKIGFTYEPTGERVNLYSPNPSAFAIVAQHPEILQAIVGARADIEGPAALSSTGDTHGN